MKDLNHNRIAELGLDAHPEGGYYREVYRSAQQVEWRGEKMSAATSILFLLQKGDVSWPHRIPQDEVWHFYEGAPFALVWFAEDDQLLHRAVLGPQLRTCAVRGDCWQAAHSLGDYSLIGCTVSPGFEFSRFELLSDFPEKQRRFSAQVDGLAPFLKRYCAV